MLRRTATRLVKASTNSLFSASTKNLNNRLLKLTKNKNFSTKEHKLIKAEKLKPKSENVGVEFSDKVKSLQNIQLERKLKKEGFSYDSRELLITLTEFDINKYFKRNSTDQFDLRRIFEALGRRKISKIGSLGIKEILDLDSPKLDKLSFFLSCHRHSFIAAIDKQLVTIEQLFSMGYSTQVFIEFLEYNYIQLLKEDKTKTFDAFFSLKKPDRDYRLRGYYNTDKYITLEKLNVLAKADQEFINSSLFTNMGLYALDKDYISFYQYSGFSPELKKALKQFLFLDVDGDHGADYKHMRMLDELFGSNYFRLSEMNSLSYDNLYCLFSYFGFQTSEAIWLLENKFFSIQELGVIFNNGFYTGCRIKLLEALEVKVKGFIPTTDLDSETLGRLFDIAKSWFEGYELEPLIERTYYKIKEHIEKLQKKIKEDTASSDQKKDCDVNSDNRPWEYDSERGMYYRGKKSSEIAASLPPTELFINEKNDMVTTIPISEMTTKEVVPDVSESHKPIRETEGFTPSLEVLSKLASKPYIFEHHPIRIVKFLDEARERFVFVYPDEGSHCENSTQPQINKSTSPVAVSDTVLPAAKPISEPNYFTKFSNSVFNPFLFFRDILNPFRPLEENERFWVASDLGKTHYHKAIESFDKELAEGANEIIGFITYFGKREMDGFLLSSFGNKKINDDFRDAEDRWDNKRNELIKLNKLTKNGEVINSDLMPEDKKKVEIAIYGIDTMINMYHTGIENAHSKKNFIG